MQNLVTEKKIKEITQKIVKEFKPEKVILFGSYAWGEPGEDSDVDLLVVKNSDKKRWEREYELRMKLVGNKFPPMDLLVYTPSEVQNRLQIGDFLIEDIVNRGKMLYFKIKEHHGRNKPMDEIPLKPSRR